MSPKPRKPAAVVVIPRGEVVVVDDEGPRCEAAEVLPVNARMAPVAANPRRRKTPVDDDDDVASTSPRWVMHERRRRQFEHVAGAADVLLLQTLKPAPLLDAGAAPLVALVLVVAARKVAGERACTTCAGFMPRVCGCGAAKGSSKRYYFRHFVFFQKVCAVREKEKPLPTSPFLKATRTNVTPLSFAR